MFWLMTIWTLLALLILTTIESPMWQRPLLLLTRRLRPMSMLWPKVQLLFVMPKATLLLVRLCPVLRSEGFIIGMVYKIVPAPALIVRLVKPVSVFIAAFKLFISACLFKGIRKKFS